MSKNQSITFTSCSIYHLFVFSFALLSRCPLRRTATARTPASRTASTGRPLEAGRRSWTNTDTPSMCLNTHRRRWETLCTHKGARRSLSLSVSSRCRFSQLLSTLCICSGSNTWTSKAGPTTTAWTEPGQSGSCQR